MQLKVKWVDLNFQMQTQLKAKYMNKGGILMKYLDVMGNMFANCRKSLL